MPKKKENNPTRGPMDDGDWRRIRAFRSPTAADAALGRRRRRGAKMNNELDRLDESGAFGSIVDLPPPPPPTFLVDGWIAIGRSNGRPFTIRPDPPPPPPPPPPDRKSSCRERV